MSIWKNVLIYADGRPESEVAIVEGIRLASLAHGTATALDVVHYLPARLPASLFALAREELVGLILEQRDEQLHEDVERLRTLQPVRVRVTIGNPAFELIRQAVNGQHDLIVETARVLDMRHKTSFGTTALHLIRKSPVPVLVLSPDKQLLQQPRVLCAIEPGEDERLVEFNRRLLRSARALAAAQQAELTVVQVLDAKTEQVYRPFLGEAAFAQFKRGLQEATQRCLEWLISRELEGLSSVRVHLLEGDPADRIVKLVANERVSHVVMGSVGYQEKGHLIGSLAEELLGRLECSLLTLKPAGFETPIGIGEAS